MSLSFAALPDQMRHTGRALLRKYADQYGERAFGVERTAAAIARDFNALTVADFNEDDPAADGWERLHALCDESCHIGPVCLPAMFEVMERLDRADFGSFSSLVHTIEAWPGRYEDLLADSIRRKPAPLTVLMVNRILNTQPDNADTWLDLLRSVRDHPAASREAKADAEDFLSYQSGTQP